MVCREDIISAFSTIVQCYEKGGKAMVCGNGGSAADSEHIVGELMKGFILKREIPFKDKERIKAAFPENAEYLAKNLQGALPAISLVSQTAISSAFINDVAADMVYAQQVYGYAREGDVLISISTSGNASNVANAVKIAKAFGVKTIGITGKSGGMLRNLCGVTIRVPAEETFRIQEYHLPVYHAVCAAVEEEFFGGK
ncbi:MAG TPA: SIS domain-containing protein [Clostridiales bacterium]|nr:SIS domain-containing protein [Clostridiales bacterium]